MLGVRDLPWSAEDVATAIRQTIAANEFGECYIRPVIWLADGGWNINVDGAKPHLGVAVWAWGAYLGEAAIEAGKKRLARAIGPMTGKARDYLRSQIVKWADPAAFSSLPGGITIVELGAWKEFVAILMEIV